MRREKGVSGSRLAYLDPHGIPFPAEDDDLESKVA